MTSQLAPPLYEPQLSDDHNHHHHHHQQQQQQQQQQQPYTTVYINQQFLDQSVRTMCPRCHNSVWTSGKAEPGLLTWLACGVLVLFGCWLGCCLIPFCVDECQDIVHTCPICRNRIAIYKRMG